MASEVLAIPMPEGNDAGAETVRDFLVALLVALWEEGEGFSGKRPLGNSDWEYQLMDAVIRYTGCNREDAGSLIDSAIRSLS